MDFQNGNAWLNDVRDAVRAGELVEPPEWVKERARRLFQRLTPASSATPTIINRIRAALVRDSRRMGVAPAGVRSLGGFRLRTHRQPYAPDEGQWSPLGGPSQAAARSARRRPGALLPAEIANRYESEDDRVNGHGQQRRI